MRNEEKVTTCCNCCDRCRSHGYCGPTSMDRNAFDKFDNDDDDDEANNRNSNEEEEHNCNLQ